MKLTPNQKKLVELTMQLDLKAKEYKELCKELDDVKKKDIDPNDESLIDLRDRFQKNLNEIQSINKQLKELKDAE